MADEYEVLVTKKGDTDEITLKMETEARPGGGSWEIQGRLKDQLRIKTNLNYKMEFHPFQSLPRPEGKARRFKDLRKH